MLQSHEMWDAARGDCYFAFALRFMVCARWELWLARERVALLFAFRVSRLIVVVLL